MFVTSQTETDRHKMALATFSFDHKLIDFFSLFFSFSLHSIPVDRACEASLLGVTFNVEMWV